MKCALICIVESKERKTVPVDNLYECTGERTRIEFDPEKFHKDKAYYLQEGTNLRRIFILQLAGSEEELLLKIEQDAEASRRTIRVPRRKSLGPLTVPVSVFLRSEDVVSSQSDKVETDEAKRSVQIKRNDSVLRKLKTCNMTRQDKSESTDNTQGKRSHGKKEKEKVQGSNVTDEKGSGHRKGKGSHVKEDKTTGGDNESTDNTQGKRSHGKKAKEKVQGSNVTDKKGSGHRKGKGSHVKEDKTTGGDNVAKDVTKVVQEVEGPSKIDRERECSSAQENEIPEQSVGRNTSNKIVDECMDVTSGAEGSKIIIHNREIQLHSSSQSAAKNVNDILDFDGSNSDLAAVQHPETFDVSFKPSLKRASTPRKVADQDKRLKIDCASEECLSIMTSLQERNLFLESENTKLQEALQNQSEQQKIIVNMNNNLQNLCSALTEKGTTASDKETDNKKFKACKISLASNITDEDGIQVPSSQIYIGHSCFVEKTDLARVESKKPKNFKTRMDGVVSLVWPEGDAKLFNLKGTDQKTQVQEYHINAVHKLLNLMSWKNIQMKPLKVNKRMVEPLTLEHVKRKLGIYLSELSAPSQRKPKRTPKGEGEHEDSSEGSNSDEHKEVDDDTHVITNEEADKETGEDDLHVITNEEADTETGEDDRHVITNEEADKETGEDESEGKKAANDKQNKDAAIVDEGGTDADTSVLEFSF